MSDLCPLFAYWTYLCAPQMAGPSLPLTKTVTLALPTPAPPPPSGNAQLQLVVRVRFASQAPLVALRLPDAPSRKWAFNMYTEPAVGSCLFRCNFETVNAADYRTLLSAPFLQGLASGHASGYCSWSAANRSHPMPLCPTPHLPFYSSRLPPPFHCLHSPASSNLITPPI